MKKGFAKEIALKDITKYQQSQETRVPIKLIILSPRKLGEIFKHKNLN